MSTADTTTEAFADTRPSDAADLPDYGIRVFTPFLSL